MGKLAFFTLADSTGKIQLYLEKASLESESSQDQQKGSFHQLMNLVDSGDWIGVTGTLRRTDRGELSLKAKTWQMLCKSLQPLPDKWHGLTDVEKRYRQRYVDLIINPDLRKTFIPIGPIAVFTPSNFPLAYSSAGGDTASALASGCSVIVKAHYMHFGTAELVSSAIIEAVKKTGMPNGVYSNINGGVEVGQDLVKNLKIKGVGFTGSKSGGRSIYNIGATREEPIPVFSEMGSINPVIISPKFINSRLEEISDILSGSIMLGAGQFCTNPGLIIIIENENTNNFTNNLIRSLSSKESQCMIHRNIKESFLKNIEFLSNQEGMEVLSKTNNKLKGNFVSPQINSVFAKDFLNNSKMHQEVFGPFSLIVKCENYDELINVTKSLEGQLTGSLFAEESELKEFSPVIDVLKDKVGRLIFNGVPTGVEVTEAMTHGGPYPASSDSRFTSVGVDSIKRWVRPITYQDWPFKLLPNDLK